MKKKFLIILILFCCTQIWLQDYFYTQKFTNPTTISPAFVGKYNGISTAFAFRDMWANLHGTYIFSDLSVDGYIPKPRLSLGAKFSYQQLGTGGYYIAGFEGTAGYNIYVVKNNDLYLISPAISFGALNSGIRLNKLLFYDQILNGGSSATILGRENRTYLDVNVGLALITSHNYGLSTSVFHVNHPNTSYEKLNVAATPMRISVFGYYNWDLSKNVKTANTQWKNQWLLFMAEWQYQAESQWIDIGLRYKIRAVALGLSFERLSVGDRKNINPTASVMIGADLKDFTIGYSFSWGMGSKNTVFGGSNEVTLKYVINTHNYERVEKKKDRQILKNYQTVVFPRI